MNLVRSTFCGPPAALGVEDARLVEKIGELICADYPSYGYRRVTAQLRRDGFVVNNKKTMKIMSQQGLSVRRRRALCGHHQQQS